MAKRNPLIRSYPKRVNKPLPNKSAGILDDYAVRKVIATKEGSITRTPVDDIDIANKKYVDDLTTDHPHQDVRTTATPTFNGLISTGQIALNSVGANIITATNAGGDLRLGAGGGTNDLKIDTGGNVDIFENLKVTKDITCDKLTITDGSQNFQFLQATALADSIAWQGQTSGASTRFGLYSKDGDGTDNVILDILGVGLPDDLSSIKNMTLGYLSSGVFILRTSNELQIRAGSGTNHIQLKTDKTTVFPAGNVLIKGGDLIMLKTVGKGIKVDTATPTFGWRDLLGETTTRNTGATKPSFEAYNGAILQYRFAADDLEHYDFHIPHDYVSGTDIHLHIHWSQISATNTGGTITFRYSAVYARGHNQANGSQFTATPITATFISADAGIKQYQHHITETIISADSATSALFDRNELEPDGVILMTLEMDANNLTDSVGVTDPFIHYVDIHYQSTNIATKDKVPNFYT